MKRFKLITAIAIVISVATMLYLVRTMDAQGADSTTKVVTITPSATPGGKPSVDHSKVTIYQSQNQQVEWTCKGGCDFTVDFSRPEGSPFSEKAFSGSATNPHAMSGVPGKKGTFRYSVTVNGGTLDPQIIVH